MAVAKIVVHSPYFLWALLALPSVVLVLTLLEGGGGIGYGYAFAEVLEMTGVFSTLLLIVAMALSPLLAVFPKSRFVNWLLRRRRYFGVAACSYAVVHVVFYFVGLDALWEALDDLAAPTIFTGWVALFIFIPMGLTSNLLMTRAMGWRRWKMVQRGAYIAAMLVLAHLLIVDQWLGPLQVLFGILAGLESYRLWRTLMTRQANQASPKPVRV